MKNSDMPAMPVNTFIQSGDTSQSTSEFSGLSKREIMAMHAMQGLLSSESAKSWYEKHEDCAEAAVNYADALLKELEK